MQIIELHTRQPAEVENLLERWRRQDLSAEHVERATVSRDADDAGHFLLRLEFPSAEASIASPRAPESGSCAGQLASLLDRPPRFLDPSTN